MTPEEIKQINREIEDELSKSMNTSQNFNDEVYSHSNNQSIFDLIMIVILLFIISSNIAFFLMNLLSN